MITTQYSSGKLVAREDYAVLTGGRGHVRQRKNHVSFVTQQYFLDVKGLCPLKWP